ncbi:hypothetical protein NN561_001475 [Cricetulus griseus]
MHSSRSVGRAPREKVQKSPRRRPGRAVFTRLGCPGELVPVVTDCRGGAPERAAVPQRKANEAGSGRTRRRGGWDSAAAPPTPGPRMLRRRVRHPRRARAPPSPAGRARSRGGGAAARAPPPQTPKLPSTRSTKLRSHRAAPRAPPRAEPEQLRSLAAEKDNRRPLPRRRRLGRGASTAVSTEPKHLAAAPPTPRPPCTHSPAHPRMRCLRTGSRRGNWPNLRIRIGRLACPSGCMCPIGRLSGCWPRLLRNDEVDRHCCQAAK